MGVRVPPPVHAIEPGFRRAFAYGYGGTPSVHVTPSLNPSPRGRDSAAEAAVRLMAKSLRSEGASIQRLSSARAVFFVRLAEVCGQLFCNSLIDCILQLFNPQTHLFSGRSADVHF